MFASTGHLKTTMVLAGRGQEIALRQIYLPLFPDGAHFMGRDVLNLRRVQVRRWRRGQRDWVGDSVSGLEHGQSTEGRPQPEKGFRVSTCGKWSVFRVTTMSWCASAMAAIWESLTPTFR